MPCTIKYSINHSVCCTPQTASLSCFSATQGRPTYFSPSTLSSSRFPFYHPFSKYSSWSEERYVCLLSFSSLSSQVFFPSPQFLSPTFPYCTPTRSPDRVHGCDGPGSALSMASKHRPPGPSINANSSQSIDLPPSHRPGRYPAR